MLCIRAELGRGLPHGLGLADDPHAAAGEGRRRGVGEGLWEPPGGSLRAQGAPRRHTLSGPFPVLKHGERREFAEWD